MAKDQISKAAEPELHEINHKQKNEEQVENNNIRKPNPLIGFYAFFLLLLVVLACNVSLNDNETRVGNSRTEETNVRAEETEVKSNSRMGNRRSSQPKTTETAENDETAESDDATENSNNPRITICKRYESCDCQTYESCMSDLKNDTTPDEPGILQCVLNSSCESLCAGKPDGCPNRKREVPNRSNCSQIRCSKDSDCPGDCHGGCSGGVCYMF